MSCDDGAREEMWRSELNELLDNQALRGRKGEPTIRYIDVVYTLEYTWVDRYNMLVCIDNL